ncbi:MAG: NAD-dependent protein deacetylase [Pseudomonadales bacterium]
MNHDWQQALTDFVHKYPRMMAITGAGISAGSGIPTYRDDSGNWQSRKPIQHDEFIKDAKQRQRYWSRSAVGWPAISTAQPNRAHHALAQLEQAGAIDLLVTQNVDRLHQRAGHQQVVDLHGRLDQVVCLSCQQVENRDQLQTRLLQSNPSLLGFKAQLRPDGDADLNDQLMSTIQPPDCLYCEGILMPDVVFFGGNVPKARQQTATQALERADALVVIGSSLTVYSGFRFCRMADNTNKPILIINRGKTRADDMATLKIDEDCAEVLEAWALI